MDAPPAGSPYAARLAELRAAVAALKARSGSISSLRGVTFLAAIGLGAVRAFRPVPVAVWIGAAAFTVAFVALVVTHAVLDTRAAAVELRIRLLERGEQRIAGAIAGFPERGERFLGAGHPYASDLDVLGPASLFQLVSAAQTGAGEAMLAHWLSSPAGPDRASSLDGGSAPKPPGPGSPATAGDGEAGAREIAARQEAVRELATATAFREDLAVCGVESGTKGHGAEPFLAWAEAGAAGPSPLLMLVGQGLVVVTMGMLLASQILGLKGLLGNLWAIPLAVQLAVLMVLRPQLEPILAPVSSREAPFGRYVALFRLIEGARFRAPRLERLHAAIAGGDAAGSPASHELGRLQTLLSFAEVRQAGIFAVLANGFLLWDVFCAAALRRWRVRAGANVRRWIEAMAELEALASIATFAAEHPAFAFPEVSAGDLHFVAEGLGHPLIPPAQRVENDVAIDAPGSGLLITGSNMSGKSTLLRAVGINAVLALAGAPVCARRLSLSHCQVRTSMRIKDSLEEGVSHFYAELQRLKTIVDAANAGERVLFLLDEVLHGTNSRERNIGAKAVVVHLLAQGAIGAVSSHDLGLADLEAESGGRVKNVHFQELVAGDRMTFDYRLKPGVVTSSNALRLMKLIGIAVALPED
jgi:hypothetical protein